MANTGLDRAAKREAEKAKAVATLYQHTPRQPESRQVRRADLRALAKDRARADKIADRRERKRARAAAKAAS